MFTGDGVAVSSVAGCLTDYGTSGSLLQLAKLKIEKTLLLALRSFSKYLILRSVCGEPLHGEHRSLHEKLIGALFRFFMRCEKDFNRIDVHLDILF